LLLLKSVLRHLAELNSNVIIISLCGVTENECPVFVMNAFMKICFTCCTTFVHLFALAVSVDATESGSGKLEIIINDGAVPCQIENSGAKKFLATFVPEEPVVHVVRVLFNNTEVAGEQHC